MNWFSGGSLFQLSASLGLNGTNVTVSHNPFMYRVTQTSETNPNFKVLLYVSLLNSNSALKMQILYNPKIRQL